MEIISGLLLILEIIGGATILLRIIAPLTKAKWDNNILRSFEVILKAISLNLNDNKITINLKKNNK